MPTMKRLLEPVSMELAGELILSVPSAGLYSDGTRADVHLYNGTLQFADIVSLSAANSRDAFAAKIAERCQVDVNHITSLLLEMKDQIDALLQLADSELGEESEPKQKPRFILDDPEPWDDPH